MTHLSSIRGARMHNLHDITSDPERVKVSALEKASRMPGGAVTDVTLDMRSMLITDDGSGNENIENEPDNRIKKEIKSPVKISSQKISTRSGITFSIKKILQENEQQRKEKVRLENQRRLRSMEEFELGLQKQMALLRETLAAARERKEKLKDDELARLEAEEEHLAQQTEIRRKHEQQLHAQRIRERNEKLEREAAEQSRRNKERRMLMERMLPLQASFRKTYQDIGSISKSCKDRNTGGSAFAPHSSKLKELSKCMEALVEHAKLGELTEADVNTAEILVKHSKDILEAFRIEIERINAVYDAEISRREYEVRRVQEQEQLAAVRAEEAEKFQSPHAVTEQVQKPSEYQQVGAHNLEQNNAAQIPDERAQPNVGESAIPETSAKPESTAGGLLEFVDKESLQLYLNSQQLLENHKTLCSSLTTSDGAKKFRLECQIAMNVPLNAISGVSSEHLTDKFEKLHRLLAGKPPTNANQHPQGIDFCKHTLAEKFVSQGEALISSKPEMAFSYAAVAVALWSEYPDFGELLLAYFHKTCPYLVPIFLPQQQGQSNNDYYKSLGYKYSDDGTVERQDKFLKRMSGLMRLYAALTVTRQRKNANSPHPHGLQNAWRWLAAILNIEPRPDVCATLILDMLEVAGNALWKTYKNQFQKLLTLLASQYYPRMQSIGAAGGGPMSRLEQFLKNCLTKGSIPPPEGQLPPNFW